MMQIKRANIIAASTEPKYVIPGYIKKYIAEDNTDGVPDMCGILRLIMTMAKNW